MGAVRRIGRQPYRAVSTCRWRAGFRVASTQHFASRNNSERDILINAAAFFAKHQA